MLLSSPQYSLCPSSLSLSLCHNHFHSLHAKALGEMHDAKLKLYTRRLNTDTEWYVWWLQLDGKTTAITSLSPITRCVIGHQRKRKLHRVAITNCYTIICSMFSSQMDSVQWLRMWERVVKCVDVMWSWSVMCQGHRLTLALCPLFCEANSPWLGCCFLSVFFAALPSLWSLRSGLDWVNKPLPAML